MTISYATIRQVNESFAKEKVSNPVGVFGGSTSGIGEHLAYEFAKVTINPTIYVIGRNPERGASVSAKIKMLNPGANVIFLQKDLSFVGEADKVANLLNKNETKINVLAQAQGELLYQSRTETKEGLDEKMALTHYGRMTIVRKCIGLVQNAANAGEPARVMTVNGAGYEQMDDFSDLDLKKKYSFVYAMKVGCAYNSLACLKLAREYPEISFIHIHPGFVKTRVARSLPFYMKLPLALFSFASRSPEKAGQYNLYACYTGKEFAKGAHLLGEDLENADKKGKESGLFSVEHQDLVWKHTEETIDAVLSK